MYEEYTIFSYFFHELTFVNNFINVSFNWLILYCSSPSRSFHFSTAVNINIEILLIVLYLY